MLAIYDINHNKVGPLVNYSNYHIERAKGQLDLLYFTINTSVPEYIKLVKEGYIATESHGEYVIKEINTSDGDSVTADVVADLNVEPLKGNRVDTFEAVEQTAKDSANLALAGTGWSVRNSDVTRRRTIRKAKVSSFDILNEIQSTFSCEMVFDTIVKKVDIYQSRGQNRGVYFAEQLNLKTLSTQGSTRPLVTCLIPVGKDGIGISTINGGLDYISNHQYTSKDVYAYWEDNRYTVIQELYDDAVERLAYLSKPCISYSASIIDLAKVSMGNYSVLDYDYGDTVTILASSKNIKTIQKIVKVSIFPDDPQSNTCEMANRIASLEALDVRFIGTSDVVDTVTTSTGMVDGSKVEVLPDANLGEITTQTLNAVVARIGSILSTTLTTTDLEAVYGVIENLDVAKADVEDLNATNITVGTLSAHDTTIVNLLSENAGITSLTSDTVKANFAAIKNGAIGTAMIQDAAITNAKIGALAVDTAKIGALAVTTAKMGDLAVTTAKIGDAAITNAKIGAIAVDTAQIKDAAITTAKIGALAVDTAKIHDAAITNAKMASLSVDTAQIADAAITNAKIGALAVSTAQIQNGSITNAKIGLLAVDSAQITDAAISNAKIGLLAVKTANIEDAAINTAKIGNLQVTGAKIANATIDTAQIKNAAITTALIADSAIDTAQIKDASISSAKIVSLSASKLTAGMIDAIDIDVVNLNAANITVGTINGEQIAIGAIEGTHIVDKTITPDKIAVKSLGADQIGVGTLTGDLLIAKTITGDKIAANSITANHLVVGLITAGSGIIGSIDAGVINTGELNGALIRAGSVDLKQATVTNEDNKTTLSISSNGSIDMMGTISSANYDDGQNLGWKIDENGIAILNQAIVRGQVELPNAGMTNAQPIDDPNPVRIWAGSDMISRDMAPFKVLQDGAVIASKGIFEGTFTGSFMLGDVEISDTSGSIDGDAVIKIVHDDGNPVEISAEGSHFAAPFYITKSDELTNKKLIVGDATTLNKDNAFIISQTEDPIAVAKDVKFPNSATQPVIQFSNGKYNVDVDNTTGALEFNTSSATPTDFDFKFQSEGEVNPINMLVDGNAEVRSVGFAKLKIIKKVVTGNSGVDFTFS